MSDTPNFGDLNLNNIMQEAQKMQQKMQEAQKNLAELIVEGTSGAGLVKVEMNGRHYVIRVKLDEKLNSESSETREDLIAAAVNDAVRKLEEESKRTIGKLTAGIDLPKDLTDLENL